MPLNIGNSLNDGKLESFTKVTVKKSGNISGKAYAPPSKSAAHRALICAALACLAHPDGDERAASVEGIISSHDMIATMGALSSIGISANRQGERVDFSLDKERFQKIIKGEINAEVDCIESGSALRFLIPVFAALGIKSTFIGRGRLPERPLNVYKDTMNIRGVNIKSKFEGEKELPLDISGKLKGGRFNVPGDVSSQFISGFLFALPLLDEDSEIVLTSSLESAPYVSLTLEALKAFGVEVQEQHPASLGFEFGGFKIKGKQKYTFPKGGTYKVEGDWSQAAFLLTLGAISSSRKPVYVGGLKEDSLQGDKKIVEILKSFGAEITFEEGFYKVKPSMLEGIRIDASQIPDLVPILSVAALFAKGETVIYNAERLRIKESDRLAAMADSLCRIGADVRQTEDGLIIKGSGTENPAGSNVDVKGYNDHRIVMSMAVAASRCEFEVTVSDAGSIAKSWPDFFEVYKSLGGFADVF